ncbi:hypothetical protein WJX74_002925 [Apatococcus lobatus]|uniref:Nuclease associated modular domain-containing protein n=1 Tax=Apatococcus lobatus TaxID=904363 RepID=A0AAW1Q918_9CHLO
MPGVPQLSRPELDLLQLSAARTTNSRTLVRLGSPLRLLSRRFHKQRKVTVAFTRALQASAAVSGSNPKLQVSKIPEPEDLNPAVSATELARRKKISNANRGKVPWNKGVPRTEEEKQKIKTSVQLAMQRPEIQGRLKTWQGRSHSSETKELLSQRLKEVHSEKRQTVPKPRPKKRTKVVRSAEDEALAKEERRQKLSEAIKAKWKDPEYRAKMDATIAARTGNGGGLTSTPSFRQRRNEARRAKTAQKNADAKAELAFARERLCKLNNARRQAAELDAAINKLRSEMHLFRSDPDAEERALAAIAKAEWTRDNAQAAIAGLAGQSPSLQELMDAAGAQPATLAFAHRMQLEEEEFLQSQPASSQPSGSRSPMSSTGLAEEAPIEPIHYQNGVVTPKHLISSESAANTEPESPTIQTSNSLGPSRLPEDFRGSPALRDGHWRPQMTDSSIEAGATTSQPAYTGSLPYQNGSQQQSVSSAPTSHLMDGGHEASSPLEGFGRYGDVAKASAAANGTAIPSDGMSREGSQLPMTHSQQPTAHALDTAEDGSAAALPGLPKGHAAARPMSHDSACVDGVPMASSEAVIASPATQPSSIFAKPGPSQAPGAGHMLGSASPSTSRSNATASAGSSLDAASPAMSRSAARAASSARPAPHAASVATVHSAASRALDAASGRHAPDAASPATARPMVPRQTATRARDAATLPDAASAATLPSRSASGPAPTSGRHRTGIGVLQHSLPTTSATACVLACLQPASVFTQVSTEGLHLVWALFRGPFSSSESPTGFGHPSRCTLMFSGSQGDHTSGNLLHIFSSCLAVLTLIVLLL